VTQHIPIPNHVREAVAKVVGSKPKFVTDIEYECEICGGAFLMQKYGQGACACGAQYCWEEGYQLVVTEEMLIALRAHLTKSKQPEYPCK
jgi:hypothetical protein